MKELSKPQYAFAIKNNLCSFIGFINDIPAFNNMQGTAFNLCVPINQFVLNGKNTFKVIIKPLKPSEYLEELSECFASIIVKDFLDNATDFIEISNSGFPAGISNDKIRLPVFELTGEFQAKLPFNNYSWSVASEINDNWQTNTENARKYIQKFHKALVENDKNYIFNEIIRREKELSQAFYEDFQIGLTNTKKVFNDTLEDKNYQLQPLNFKEFIPKFYAEGRMITFENIKYQQAVFFQNNKEGLRREFPLFLCLNAQKEMIIIR